MAAPQMVEIPDRLFFRIGDVSRLTGVETYVLRFWETEFPNLSPKKTSTGQRQYRRKDVQTVLEIKRLLYDEGYTIPGARKALRGKAKQKRKSSKPRKQSGLFKASSAVSVTHIENIKNELKDILSLLSRS